MSLFCTACGCSYGTPREAGEACGDLSCWSRIACAGVLRDVPYDDDVRRLQETALARDIEGELLASVLAGKRGLDDVALHRARTEAAERARELAAERARRIAKAEGR